MSVFINDPFGDRGSQPRCSTMRACQRRHRLAATFLLVTMLASRALAEDAPAAEQKSAAKALQRLYQADAETYHFYADQARQQPFKFVSKPVMHWASPNDWSGDVFVWTQQGRPAVVGCMLSGPGNNARAFYHEFHALTLKPLPQQPLGPGRTWSLDRPAIELQLLKDAPAVADSPAARLAQMRSLAREFTVTMQADDKPWELRLLSQPIFRYDASEAEPAERAWLDGALFTYVWTTGTDAEVLLILEARRMDGEFRWHYAPARLTNREALMKHRDAQVWQVPAHAETGAAITRPYSTFYSRTVSVPAEPPAEPSPAAVNK